MDNKLNPKQKFIVSQLTAACRGEKVTCRCGVKAEVYKLYKCLYCGEFFCQKCAERHFGETRKQYIERKSYKHCPICGESLVFPRVGTPYCEECGYEQ